MTIGTKAGSSRGASLDLKQTHAKGGACFKLLVGNCKFGRQDSRNHKAIFGLVADMVVFKSGQ